MAWWRFTARKQRPALVGYTPTGICYRVPPPWLQVVPAIQHQWSLVCKEAVYYRCKGKTPWSIVSPILATQWKVVCGEVEKFKWNTHMLAVWQMSNIDLMLWDLKKCGRDGEVTDPEDSNFVPVSTFESVDELTLFGVLSPSLSEGGC